MNTQQRSIHWLAVGKVSGLAQAEVLRTGGQVVYVASEPVVTLVGIAHQATRPSDLAFNHASEIQIDVHSTGLAVVWASSDRLINAAYNSLTETELITYQEYESRLMDATTTDVPVTTGIDADAPTYFDGLEDLEDHPF